MTRRLLLTAAALIASLSLAAPTATAKPSPETPVASLFVTGMASGSGSTIGPDGGLYVTEGATGTILRVDPETGSATPFATGLPSSIIGIGGAMDVAFVDGTAYALVTLVGSQFGGNSIVGIYRMDSPSGFSVIADIGAFAEANPPDADIFIPTGLQYAMEPYRGGFLVTDGHHNRVYGVTLDGHVTEQLTVDNVVPTGLARRGSTIYLAEAGAVPHEAVDGKIVTFRTDSTTTDEVASGARLLVDVEFGRGHDLYGLSQGVFPPGGEAGSPAMPDTGSLVIVNKGGTFSTVVDGLNQPTSLELVGDAAFVVTLGGEIWKVSGL